MSGWITSGILFLTLGALAALAAEEAPADQGLQYPPADRGDVVDDYFGTKVPAPYRWMEDLNSPAVKQWVAVENKLTFDYLETIPVRGWINRRLTQLWNYEKVGVPDRVGGKLYFSKNSGLQDQAVLYEQGPLDGQPKQLLDPNTLSTDGSIALAGNQPSPDGRYLAYGLSQGGSDWETLHVRDLSTGKALADAVRWVKFSGISWTRDGKGFFYSRYPAPPQGEAIAQQVRNQKLYYHHIGTPQESDKLIYARPDLPNWIVGGTVSEDGRYLFVVLINGTAAENELYYVDLGDPYHPDIAATIEPLYTKNDAEYAPIGVVGDTLYLQTTLNAPKRRIVAASLEDPSPANWRTVVPESDDVIQTSLMAGGRVVAQYLVDAKSDVRLFATDGKLLATLDLPALGSVYGLSARNDTPELFYGFTSYLYSAAVYRYDLKTGKSRVFAQPKVDFDASRYETRQVFYRSKDGTRVPMFITARKGVELNGRNPTVLYAYGGFDISVTPGFSPVLPVWLELGGVYAVANLRGGGEYGKAWHDAGMLGNKQNVFDDFIWAAKYLQNEGYTSPGKLAIQGYSNGGLLVGASITEQPGLYGAAYAGAGVMDMLRYQKFSGGGLWAPEYGTADDPQAFKWLYAYSPVQNLSEGVCYPPTIVTTADHDDRVVPSHSYKFVATMQHDQGCDNPVLIRIATQTSHGYMPTDKRIAQTADVWAFEAYSLGITEAPAERSGGTAGDAGSTD